MGATGREEAEVLFRFEEEEFEAVDEPAGLCSSQNALMRAHLSFLLRPATERAAQLARSVELCTLRHSLRTGQLLCSPQELASALAALGYAATVRRAVGGGSGVAAFRNLRHSFVMVPPPPRAWWQPQPQRQPQQRSLALTAPQAEAGAGGDEAAAAEEAVLIVDPHFACQFVVACPSPRYSVLQRLLPQTFVGTAEQLEHVVEWACREMEWSFKQQGQCLPPWREQRAMLTKWQPRDATPQPGAPAGSCSSPAGSPPGPCCCCCRQGSAAVQAPPAADTATSTAADARRSGLRSPSSVLSCSTAAMQPAAAALACSSSSNSSAPTSPTTEWPSVADRQPRRKSLLSRSLEAAGIRRTTSTPAPQLLPRGSQAGGTEHDWWQPRVHVVRRSS